MLVSVDKNGTGRRLRPFGCARLHKQSPPWLGRTAKSMTTSMASSSLLPSEPRPGLRRRSGLRAPNESAWTASRDFVAAFFNRENAPSTCQTESHGNR